MKLLDNFILRTPLLAATQSIDQPFKVFKESLLVQEAIFLSSKVLYDRINEVINHTELDPEKILKIENSLLKYLKRLSTRATPFGINGLISVGKFGNETNLSFKGDAVERSVRFDMQFLSKVYSELIKTPAIIERLIWYSNNTLYKFNNTYRFVDYTSSSSDRVYQISQAKANDVLDSVIRLAKNGITVQAFRKMLGAKGFDPIEISAYLMQLIESKILTSNLEPSISGTFYGVQLSEFLKENSDVISRDLKTFIELQKTIAKANSIESYQNISKVIEKTNLPRASYFHINSCRQLESNSISRDVFKHLPEAMKLSLYFSEHIKNIPQRAIDDFTAEFVRRYEGQELPLLMVLDPDLSIGYPYSNERSIGDEVSYGLGGGGEMMTIFEMRDRFQTVINKYYQCISTGGTEIEFTESEYNAIAQDVTLPSAVIATMGSLVQLENGIDFIQSASDLSSAATISRFSGLSKPLHDTVQAVCTIERDHFNKENILIAELVFVPSEQGANIVSKTHLRDFEIPAISQSSLPIEQIIPLDDITISVSNGRIVMKSKSRNSIILPKFTSIFNPIHCQLPVFNLFSDLKYAGMQGGLTWNWSFLAKMPFQPRVRYKNIILSKASWLVKSDEIAHIKKGDLAGFKKFLAHRRIPKKVLISQGDDIVIPIHFESEKDVYLFISELRKYQALTVSENPHADDEYLVRGDSGHYAHEVVINWDNLVQGPVMIYKNGIYKNKKHYTPGSEWTYLSIFCSQKTADTILRDYVDKLIKKGIKDEQIDTWFFIRYGDPRNHVRLRIKPKKEQKREIENALSQLAAKLHQKGLAWDVKSEIYSRELHRYGDSNISSTEKLFQFDSEFIIELLNIFDDSALSAWRWKVAVLSLDALLDDFQMTLADKIAMLKEIKLSFFAENSITSKSNLSWFKDTFRSKRDEIENLLNKKDESVAVIKPLIEKRSRKISRVRRKILANIEKEASHSIYTILPSYMHMFMNRLFVNQQRRQEMVIYDLMHQHYLSVSGRVAVKNISLNNSRKQKN